MDRVEDGVGKAVRMGVELWLWLGLEQGWAGLDRHWTGWCKGWLGMALLGFEMVWFDLDGDDVGVELGIVGDVFGDVKDLGVRIGLCCM